MYADLSSPMKSEMGSEPYEGFHRVKLMLLEASPEHFTSAPSRRVMQQRFGHLDADEATQQH